MIFDCTELGQACHDMMSDMLELRVLADPKASSHLDQDSTHVLDQPRLLKETAGVKTRGQQVLKSEDALGEK